MVGEPLAASMIRRQLRYRDHQQPAGGSSARFQVGLEDPVTGLRVGVFYQVLPATGCWVLGPPVQCGSRPVTIEPVTSFLAGGLPGPPGGTTLDELDVL